MEHSLLGAVSMCEIGMYSNRNKHVFTYIQGTYSNFIFKFPVFSLTGYFFLPFSLFSLCSGYPYISLLTGGKVGKLAKAFLNFPVGKVALLSFYAWCYLYVLYFN